MTKRITAMLLLLCMVLSLLTGCGGKEDEPITPEQAQQIVLEDLGVSAGEVTMHVHVTNVDDAPCYGIYVTVGGENLEYIVNGITGAIVSVNESTHSH